MLSGYVLLYVYIMNYEAIEQQLRKEQKSGLGYILTFLDRESCMGLYWDHYKKTELLERVLSLRNNWYKLLSFQTYKQYDNASKS